MSQGTSMTGVMSTADKGRKDQITVRISNSNDTVTPTTGVALLATDANAPKWKPNPTTDSGSSTKSRRK